MVYNKKVICSLYSMDTSQPQADKIKAEVDEILVELDQELKELDEKEGNN